MGKNDDLYLRHIFDSIALIEKYLLGVEYEVFIKENMIQDAVIRQLEIIGEASGKLSEATRNSYRSVPWTDIIGMRNKLIHDYFGVDMDAVWQTTVEDIPLLKTKLNERPGK